MGLLILYWLVTREKAEDSQSSRFGSFESSLRRKKTIRTIDIERDPLLPLNREPNIYENHSRSHFFPTRDKRVNPKVRISRNFLPKKRQPPVLQPVEKVLQSECCICKTTLKAGDIICICPFCKTPSHKNELESWLDDREVCPYCQTPLTAKTLRPIKFTAKKICWACGKRYQVEKDICPKCGRPSQCLICKDDIAEEDSILICPHCFSAYHQACGVPKFSPHSPESVCLNCNQKIDLEDLSLHKKLSLHTIEIPRSLLQQTLGKAKISTEKDLQLVLEKHPSLIEPGMNFVGTGKFELGAGFDWENIIDLRLLDRNGRDVFVELKRDPISRASGHDLLGQLVKYLFIGIPDGIKEGKIKPGVRTLVITGGYRKREIVLSLHKLGIELCKYRIDYES
ncbi:MAG: hypothetical protein ACFFBD_02785 [Candidatus Hodarchaeota archaeon]